ncbi:hypothetical protein N0V93_003797 [Gnomoniopsis smithogilvyi]|uniref:Dihydroneopterin aldolase/epimerase domain-containing protein n=1 Tax=Gnomoniopsis smithogilvyi TaxID=1191159 RepID=A0A9W8YZW3_9PEZI|nr:hypothetical protein N0V93_003797 [Gnomoniopsis smithogilvyi]
MSLRSLWTVRQAAGEPLAVVRVRQLTTACIGPQDAWGRKNATQPVTISAELHFSRAFDAAATGDNVTAGDTVHYGQLSKLILACVERSNEHAAASGASVDLRVLLEMIWIVLTGRNVNGQDSAPEATPLLDLAKLRYMSLTVTLPKASLLGEGVSLTAVNVFPPHLASLSMYGLALKVHRLRVPTLIGVNANERQAKQFVVADVEIDRFDYYPDLYCELERLVVKAMETSRFETLEALGAHLARTLQLGFKPDPKDLVSGDEGWQIKLSMEKPTAVPFAECPVVEMRVASTP